MRILCSCNSLLGHVYPMLPLARALRDDGHEVCFATGADVASLLGETGFAWRRTGPEFVDLVAEALTRYPDSSFATPADQQRFGFERLFSEVRVDLTAADLLVAAREMRPALILHEVADFVAPLVAAQIDVPSVTLGVGLTVADEWLALAAAGVAPAWARADLPPPVDAGVYRSLYLNQVPRSFQRVGLDDRGPVRDLRPVVVGEGEDLPPDLAGLGNDRPLVYVTFGTVFGDVDAVGPVVDGLADADVDVLVTGAPVGFTAPNGAGRARLEVRSFVPQGAVLSQCRVAVTHGGVGSVIGPLRYGVPLLVVPLGADQAENAARVVEVGAGRALDPDGLGPDEVHDAVEALLDDDACASVARAIRDEIATMPEPAALAAELEQLV